MAAAGMIAYLATKATITLVGGAGDDLINGAGFAYNDTTGPQSFRREEIDTLTAGVGKDIFQLWGGSGREAIHAYHDAAGNSDYALITDFNPKSDIIKLTTQVRSSLAASTVSYSLSALTEKLGT